MALIRYFTIVLLLTASEIASAQTDTASAPEAAHGFGLSVWVGNESNKPDGVFGPFTYGLTGSYTSPNGWAWEADFIRMHEPGMRTFDSFLDEGYLTFKLSPNDTYTYDATLWRNRMMDMYTTVGGLEVTRNGKDLTLIGGVHAGAASREEASGQFLGMMIGIGHSFGPLEASLSHFAGLIKTAGDPSALGTGKYHKSSLELSLPVYSGITPSVSVERRYFDFGNGGPASDDVDTYIIILGVEISLTDLFSRSRSSE